MRRDLHSIAGAKTQIKGRLSGLEKADDRNKATLSQVNSAIESLRQDNEIISRSQNTNQPMDLDAIVVGVHQAESNNMIKHMKKICAKYLEIEKEKISANFEKVSNKISVMATAGQRNDINLSETNSSIASLLNEVKTLQNQQANLEDSLTAFRDELAKKSEYPELQAVTHDMVYMKNKVVELSKSFLGKENTCLASTCPTHSLQNHPNSLAEAKSKASDQFSLNQFDSIEFDRLDSIDVDQPSSFGLQPERTEHS
ncbi:hypothetical protein PtB15_10B233 [Puccinia triticina]|nr:hypothetical protein PtB15_10B233 [Puccinia triticina]